ncbi:MAG: succinylglutamate desuccinylase/aspartoacylase family protein [Gammaproteobacteria bacterium]|nr:succinylglutamate desuccinylase/aspartoacylase family protein [Gammaproteobacteria bacterium]
MQKQVKRKPKAKADAPKFTIGGATVAPGERCVVELPIAALYTHAAPLQLPVHVVSGKRTGPRLFLSAAIHGDELNGVEIIRRVLAHRALAGLRGVLLAVPVVNAFGMILHSRYLPDRRDLNRSFPGSATGSLAARLAHLMLEHVIKPCSYGIDLHTGSSHRANLPQIRADLSDEETLAVAQSFGVPVLINSTVRDGSLRGEATAAGVRMLLYEAGEALRYDELAIRVGVEGVLNVMRGLGMLPPARKQARPAPFISHSSSWVRAPSSGVVITHRALGDQVTEGDELAQICDPSDFFSGITDSVVATATGIIIGRTNLPLVNEGDALFHIARFEDAESVAAELASFHQDIFDPEQLY